MASKQNWENGNTVKVGFLTLKVVEKIESMFKGSPAKYALQSLDGTKFYCFIPHNGIWLVGSLEEARKP